MKLATLNGGDQIQRALTDGGHRGRWAFVTLTYRPGVDWQARHVTELCKHVRHWLERRGHRARYEWVAELTKAGAVHYHLIVWVPNGLTLPKPDKQRWWPHGLTRIETARRPVGYLAKYVSKSSDANSFPRGLRLHGRGGLDDEGRRVVAWWLLPRYVREFADLFAERIRRARGGGWISRDTGQWWPAWGAS
jgi:hypothetical protein